ncbi:hypothetical protein [Serratia marcescens]|uniref:hypothetical protein n=1 Tax=Serratia marcescens TaxID=615 RepID=UPI001A2D3BAC|nr:hypothetical protein [Serratia marcescens]HEJ7025608.1 hypothetical protein [Serratia marcescens]
MRCRDGLKIRGQVNPDVFCTLVVLFGVGMVQGIAPPSRAIRVKGANAILAMGIFSINRHKQSDIFMKK